MTSKADEYRQWIDKLNEYYPDYINQINKLAKKYTNKKKSKNNNPNSSGNNPNSSGNNPNSSGNNPNSSGNNIINQMLEYYNQLYKKLIKELEELKDLEKKNNKNNKFTKEFKEDDIFKIMEEIIGLYHKLYKIIVKNNKVKVGPRNTNRYKQSIYTREIELIKNELIRKLDEFSFEELCDYVALKRKMIEFLKLTHARKGGVSFDYFGKKRIHDRNNIKSPFIASKAQHLVNRFGFSNEQIKYKNIDLTKYEIKMKRNEMTGENKLSALWFHTSPKHIPKLFKIMNELYDLLRRTNNKTTNKKQIAKLYWLYMQTCPYHRGSASIGEILFSVLLNKYLDCDFKISSGWNKNPETIPDIHALSYDLNDFLKIFYSQFTTCPDGNNGNNGNNGNDGNNGKKGNT
jgi:hypothetical protein